jgi:alpha-L-arabinofuranosidase
MLAQQRISGLTTGWANKPIRLTPSASTSEGRLVISIDQPGVIYLDVVSLFPEKTWKNRANGLRPDLMQFLDDMKPNFVRFPGGCWVEGDTMVDAYDWKQTVGDIAARRNQHNIWRYEVTNGLGYHEYLQMCEDLGADAMYVANCGMSHNGNTNMGRIQQKVQDALDAVEYALGDVSTVWGAVRAANGHPEPFPLKYLEVGNENGGPAYHERYAVFYKALKQKYPNLQVIANVRVPGEIAPTDILDEHYYSTPAFFIANANRYDTYDRKGPKIYVGEYAVTAGGHGNGNLRAALGEAAFIRCGIPTRSTSTTPARAALHPTTCSRCSRRTGRIRCCRSRSNHRRRR